VTVRTKPPDVRQPLGAWRLVARNRQENPWGGSSECSGARKTIV